MSSNYFILRKSKKVPIDDNSENQILILNDSLSYILPETNLQYYYENGLFENGLIEWCKQLCNMDKVFLDIGAHTGTYSISLSNYSKEVFSFEPQKMTYYALCGSVAISNKNNITCYNVGLGSKEQEGETILNIISNDGGGSSINLLNKETVLRQEKITIKTLDSFEIENIGFIKIDVENNELEVLKGAIQTIERSKPKILFESNNENKELFRFILNDLKYNKIYNIYGIHNMFLAE
jgi:FkbM family methyltransferase